MKNKILIVSVIIMLLGLLVGYYTKTCWIKIEYVQLTELVNLLMVYGIIATLIERLVDKGIYPQPYNQSKQIKNKINQGLITLDSTNPSTDETMLSEYEKKFSWTTFAIGFVVASLGFKFFINITSPQCTEILGAQMLNPISENPKQVIINSLQIKIFLNYLYPLVDIFLTAILLSGGAQLIRDLIGILKEFLDSLKGQSNGNKISNKN